MPTPRPGHVPRPRLGERFNVRSLPALTLVSAPPGFGKTALLTEWLAGRDSAQVAAWVSLDEGDNDPVVFWTYLVSALRRAAPGVGESSMTLLEDSPVVPMRTLITMLVNDLSAADCDLVLVLDDYHHIQASELQESMSLLIARLPPRARVVIASRSDPPFPLARLRSTGQLLEIRAAELRFSRQEADDYLGGMLSGPVPPEDVDALEQRTEGWIAALQLAALSMQRVDDISSFVAGFAGDDRYILDYLVEEVLDHQPPSVRDFLLHTSILDRLTGPLCDAVTGGANGTALLETLERSNLFVVALDDRRRWYRYHHLFGDVLHARLREELPTLVPDLQRRAAAWYDATGHAGEAVRHALAGGDVQFAADCIERAEPFMRQTRQEVTLRRWFDALPEEVFADRPALAVASAGARLAVGDARGVDKRLAQAEQRLAKDPQPEADGGLAGWVAVYRSASAQLRGDLEATVAHAGRAQELIAPDDHAARGAARSLRGLAAWARGDLDAAYAEYSAGMQSLDSAGFAADVVGGMVTLADLRIAQGRLRDARALYEQGLKRATAVEPALRGAADMHVGLAMLDIETGDSAAAERHLRQSVELGDQNGFPKNPYRSRVARARLAELSGQVEAALELLWEAEEVFTSDFSPNVRPVPALLVRAGRIDDAGRWVDERGLTLQDEVSYLSEFEHLSLARVLLARGRSSPGGSEVREAAALLNRLLAAAESSYRAGSTVESLLLSALASRQLNDHRRSFEFLERALRLAEPEGYVRVFLDEGTPMKDLLRAVSVRSGSSRYLDELLGAIRARDAETRNDLLTDRELGVLRLLATDLSGPDIARELVVSLNTVRSHVKSIYSKLEVGDRRAAVRRAGELGLLRTRRT